MHHWDSNSEPRGYESPPLTARPGLALNHYPSSFISFNSESKSYLVLRWRHRQHASDNRDYHLQNGPQFFVFKWTPIFRLAMKENFLGGGENEFITDEKFNLDARVTWSRYHKQFLEYLNYAVLK